jgi:antitoxin component YwqK of YwqJK toxin-antitoxin module
MPLVSNRTATVHFQKETAFNNGLVAIIPYKNGKINGISKGWYHSSLITYTEYKDNKVNGFDFTWYTNGVPRMEWYNSNGCHRVKSTRYWHANGRLNSAFKIKDGEIQYEDGQKTWHANGAVESQYFKIPGSNNWLVAYYYPDGKPQCFEYMHDNDYGIGPKMEFYKNGMPEWFVQNENDTKHYGNAVINWYTNGTKKLEHLLVTNKTTVIREWKPDGKLISEGFYKDDNPWNGTFYRSWGKYKGKILRFKDGKMIDPSE